MVIEVLITPVRAALGSRCDIHPDKPAVAWIVAQVGSTLGDPCLGCAQCVQLAQNR